MTHPDPEVLAEFRAGLITGRRGARISAHLAACDHCTGLAGQLAEVSALLAATPAPAMPDSVARRLDTVFAAEAAGREDPERADADRPQARMKAPPPRRHWDFRLVAQRVLIPAAAVAVLAAGGFGLSRIGSSPASSAASGSAASAVASATQAGAVPSAAPTGRSALEPAIPAPVSFKVVISRTYYLRATLRQQIAREMELRARESAGPQTSAAVAITGCVLRVTRGTSPGTLLLVEKAHFQGQPAIVIVAVSGHRDAAWVTSSGCSSASDHVLDTTTLPGTTAP